MLRGRQISHKLYEVGFGGMEPYVVCTLYILRLASKLYKPSLCSEGLESWPHCSIILAIIGISTIRSPSAVHSVRLCCRSQLWLYVRYGTACTCSHCSLPCLPDNCNVAAYFTVGVISMFYWHYFRLLSLNCSGPAFSVNPVANKSHQQKTLGGVNWKSWRQCSQQ